MAQVPDPLRPVADLLPALKAGMQACAAEAAFLSPINVMTRLALGKWTFESVRGHPVFTTPYGAVVLPLGDKRTYYSALVSVLMDRPCVMVPAYMAEILRQRGMRASLATKNYILSPDRVRDLPGGPLKRSRAYVKVARRAHIVDHDVDVPSLRGELGALNDLWYREAATRKYRTFEKRHIEWAFDNWCLLHDLEPSLLMTVCRETASGRMTTFQFGCDLTPDMSVTYCERYDREAMRCQNLLSLGEHVTRLGKPKVNDGPADNPLVRAMKERLSGEPAVPFFRVERAR